MTGFGGHVSEPDSSVLPKPCPLLRMGKPGG